MEETEVGGACSWNFVGTCCRSGHNVADLKAIVTAQKPTSVTDSVVGHFTAPNELNLIIRFPFDQSKGSLLT